MMVKFRTDQLSKPIKIGNKEAKNRIFLNAMEGNDSDEEGNPSSKTIRRYKELFEGDAGMISSGALTITYESRGRKYQESIMPRNREALKNLVEEMREVNEDPLFIFQLTHSGELSTPDFSKRVTVKELPGFGGELLTEEDVRDIQDKFVRAARIAYECGADGVDFKLCHGYLGSQILRPYNDRDWEFGGSWENRSKFAFETFERMVDEVGDSDFLFGSKVSLWEGFPGGQGTAGPDSAIMDLEEPLDLIKGLEKRGADFVIQSAGCPSITLALTQPDARIPRDVYLHQTFQQRISEVVGSDMVVIGSGYSAFRNGDNRLQAVKKEEASIPYWGNKCIEDGVTDMVAIGRQSLADPKFPKKLLYGDQEDINWCTTCDGCVELLIRQENVGCTVHYEEYRKLLEEVRKEKGRIIEKRT
ncbi:MAG: 2,4-dienoyl-CoA reductase [Candidatus Hadarchaeia archaeon]